jgi:hypothetical protein
MKTVYCLVYEKMLPADFLDGGFTRTVGPFKTIKAAQDWYAANTPDHEAAIDTIYVPEGE